MDCEPKKKKNVRREDLFPASCLINETSKKICEPETGRAAFLISEEAIKRLISGNGEKTSPAKKSSVFELQEQEWRLKENCIDKLHAEKVGIDERSIYALEMGLKDIKACTGEFDIENKPLLQCFQENMITPLKCRSLVADYLKTISKYREQVFGTRQ